LSYENDLELPQIEWCKLVKGMKTTPLFETLLGIAAELAKDLLEVCFRTGEFKVSNITHANLSYIRAFPSGEYKSVYRVYDEFDGNIFNLTHYAVIRH
jgi:hypothetical protein